MKRIIALALALSSLLCGCMKTEYEVKGSCNIKAAVFGSETESSSAYNELKNGIMANLDVDMLSATDNLSEYDIVYLDSDAEKADTDAVIDYVRGGGTVVLDNSFVDKFPLDFLGAQSLADVVGLPVDLQYSYTDENLTNISELLYDYTWTLKSYGDFNDYTEYNYGKGIVPSTAKVIAGQGETGIYTINHYGDGVVFITNPILPGDFTVTEFGKGRTGQPMAFSTVAAQSLLRSYYAEYVSKKKYGFAVERAYGSFASNPAAWELHYEDITGIQNASLIDFAGYCMENSQMPSFTLVRNSYTWFKRAESVTYLEYDGGFKNDAYEGAYCSGTHIAAGGKWLELDGYEETDSYFEDNPEYIKRAYPCPIDWNDDGKTDLICGSADGRFYYFEGRGMGSNYETGAGVWFTDHNGNPLSVGAYSSPNVFDINGDGRGEIVSGAEDGIIRAFRSLKDSKNPKSMAFELIGEVINTGLCDATVASGHLNGDNITDLAVGSRSGEMRVYYGYTEDGKNTLYNDYITVDTGETHTSPCIYNGKLFCGTLQGYIACFEFDGTSYVKTGYLETDTNSRRGDKRITIGMNSVPRFYDIDCDADDDLICGSLEYGMAYPIDSEYFPYKDELREQLDFCAENGIYVGVHGLTHRYASPKQEEKELGYHKSMFEKLGLDWAGVGINQHTWYTSQYGYDGSGINGYNPAYDGTFAAQSKAGLLWNSGSTLPESKVVPQNCAENAIPMPMYLDDLDFIVFETSNTPHGNGAHSFTSVKYKMPLLFYNHCDYMYEDGDNQKAMSDRVGELVDKYDYMFVREDQMAKAVSAAYNTDIKVDAEDGVIRISSSVRDMSRRLYDESYTDCVGVRVVFADGVSADEFVTDASVYKTEKNVMSLGVNSVVTVKRGLSGGDINIREINLPAEVKIKGSSAVIDFKDGGMMYARVKGDAVCTSKGWETQKDGNDTVFVKFGKADKLKVKVK